MPDPSYTGADQIPPTNVRRLTAAEEASVPGVLVRLGYRIEADVAKEAMTGSRACEGAAAGRACEGAANAVRPSGLPILSTEKLTFAERAALLDLARLFRLVGDRLDEALETGRVDRALEACAMADEAGLVSARAKAKLGSNR